VFLEPGPAVLVAVQVFHDDVGTLATLGEAVVQEGGDVGAAYPVHGRGLGEDVLDRGGRGAPEGLDDNSAAPVEDRALPTASAAML